jgi:hypothetical protein
MGTGYPERRTMDFSKLTLDLVESCPHTQKGRYDICLVKLLEVFLDPAAQGFDA